MSAATASRNGTVTVKSGDGTTSTAPTLVQSVSPGLFTLNSNNLAAAYVTYAQPNGTQTNDKIFLVLSGVANHRAKEHENGFGPDTSTGFGTSEPFCVVLPASLAGAGDVPIVLAAADAGRIAIQ